ncbi:galactose-1-phosphate uridylyltransferase, partial [Bacillus velezensis]
MSERQSVDKDQDRELSRHLAHDIDETVQQSALYAVEQLVAFAHKKGLIGLQDTDYSRNLLLEQFGFSEPYSGGEAGGIIAPEALQP